jgi:hypothetical protein
MKLDTFVTQFNLNQLDFIKIDVDGFEDKVFEGAKESIKKFRPFILFEFSPKEIISHGKTPNEVIEFLLKNNYTLFDDKEKMIKNISIHIEKINKGIISNMIFAIAESKVI